MRALVLVDHAVGTSGPHRNVVGSLNALGTRSDLTVRLLAGAVDETEPYAHAANLEIRLGFHPHSAFRFAANCRAVLAAARGCEVLYVPTNLKSLLYAQLARVGRRVVAGPNVTPLPIRRSDSPGRPELALMCDLWLEASDAKKDHVIARSGFSNVRCIRHSIDGAMFSPNRRSVGVWERYGILSGTTKVLYVGRDDEPRKGVRQLIDAVEQLNCSGLAGDLDFIFVGRMSEATVRRTAAMPNVHRLGFIKGVDLANVYAGADIAVVPSSWENMPFSVLEAMSSGLAVLAPRVGGIPEQVVDGESGVLLDLVGDDGRHRRDAGKILAEAIRGLTDNPGRRHHLGQAARRRTLEHFSEARLGAELAEALRPASRENTSC